MDNIEECGTNEGMPMVPPSLPQPTEDKGNPVTVNVSMNASGKEHVADLLDMMKNAGLGGAEEVSAKTLSPRMDMERLKGIIDGPKDMDDLKPGDQGKPCPKCGKQHIGASSCMDSIEEGGMSDKAIEIEEWIEKYETKIGNNGDTLPEGYVKYFMDSGIFSDAYEQNETAKAEKMIGKPYTEWDDNDQEKALEMMPITSAMFDEIEKITGTSGEDAAEMVSDIMDNMDEAYDNEPDERYGSIDDVIASGDDLHRTKKAYAATQDGDNPMAVEDEQNALEQEIRAALQNEYASFKEGEPEGDHDHDEGEECPECGAPGKQKLMACSSCGCS